MKRRRRRLLSATPIITADNESLNSNKSSLEKLNLHTDQPVNPQVPEATLNGNLNYYKKSNLTQETYKPPSNIIFNPKAITASKKDIYIFFHIYCVNNYLEVADEIIRELFYNGLYFKCKKIFYSMSGFPQEPLKSKVKFSDKFELVNFNTEGSEVEYPILSYMESFCKDNDCYVLYLHTKGVSLPKDEYRQNWRKRLLQKVVRENDICISMLNEGCDIAGCGWKEVKDKNSASYNVGKHPHYSGNFWWANSQYIRLLPSISKIKNEFSNFKETDFLTYRTQCEFWIGMNKNVIIGVNGELNKEYSNTNYHKVELTDLECESNDIKIDKKSPTPSIGIGITTRNRKSILRFVLEKFKEFKIGRIIIVDDNSDEKLSKEDIGDDFEYYYNEKRLGVAKSKNKCLSILNKEDYVFLFDDDCFPIVDNWWNPWIESSENHLAFSIDNKSKIIKENELTFWYNGCLGVCLFFTRKCLDVIGGFDKRFGIWGGEHHEITTRIYKSGLTKHPYICPKNTGIWAFDAQGDYGDFKWNHMSSLSKEEKSKYGAEIPSLMNEIVNDTTFKRTL